MLTIATTAQASTSELIRINPRAYAKYLLSRDISPNDPIIPIILHLLQAAEDGEPIYMTIWNNNYPPTENDRQAVPWKWVYEPTTQPSEPPINFIPIPNPRQNNGTPFSIDAAAALSHILGNGESRNLAAHETQIAEVLQNAVLTGEPVYMAVWDNHEIENFYNTQTTALAHKNGVIWWVTSVSFSDVAVDITATLSTTTGLQATAANNGLLTGLLTILNNPHNANATITATVQGYNGATWTTSTFSLTEADLPTFPVAFPVRVFQSPFGGNIPQ